MTHGKFACTVEPPQFLGGIRLMKWCVHIDRRWRRCADRGGILLGDIAAGIGGHNRVSFRRARYNSELDLRMKIVGPPKSCQVVFSRMDSEIQDLAI